MVIEVAENHPEKAMAKLRLHSADALAGAYAAADVVLAPVAAGGSGGGSAHVASS